MKKLVAFLALLLSTACVAEARPLCPACPPYPLITAGKCIAKAVKPKHYKVTVVTTDGKAYTFDRWATSVPALKARLWVNKTTNATLRVWGLRNADGTIPGVYKGVIKSINIVRVDAS